VVIVAGDAIIVAGFWGGCPLALQMRSRRSIASGAFSRLFSALGLNVLVFIKCLNAMTPSKVHTHIHIVFS